MVARLFRIKICGLTSVEDAISAADAGADALGFNFYPGSPRCIDQATAQAMAGAVRADRPNGPRFVGVFVNAPTANIVDLVRNVPLDMVQLHGDETPELACELDRLLREQNSVVPILRAYRCRQSSLSAITADLRRYEQLQPPETPPLPLAVLLDAFQPGAFGGTGEVLDWQRVRDERAALLGRPLILAGGLTAENVAEAIHIAQPDAVDVASGVESAAGKKSREKMTRFVAAARAGWEP